MKNGDHGGFSNGFSNFLYFRLKNNYSSGIAFFVFIVRLTEYSHPAVGKLDGPKRKKIEKSKARVDKYSNGTSGLASPNSKAQ